MLRPGLRLSGRRAKRRQCASDPGECQETDGSGVCATHADVRSAQPDLLRHLDLDDLAVLDDEQHRAEPDLTEHLHDAEEHLLLLLREGGEVRLLLLRAHPAADDSAWSVAL